MTFSEPEVFGVLSRLKDGDQEAARKIYERFVDHLVGLATQKLDRRLQAKIDPESVAHSAFMSFFDRHRDGAYDLQNWGMVFGLLSHITFCKCLNRNRHFRQQRRDESQVVHFEDWKAIDKAPGPDEVLMVDELLESAFRILEHEDRRKMVELYLDGHTTDEVANRTGFSQRTVQRAIEEFRSAIQKELSKVH